MDVQARLGARPTEDEQRAAEKACSSIYEETSRCYESVTPRLAGQALGYRILYGPPVVCPAFLFLGYQPGGRADSVRPEQLRGWPSECEYALDKPGLKDAGWVRPAFAINMQRVWGIPTLKNSVGLNAIFFRAPNMGGWARVERELRNKLEAFSLERVQRIVGTLRPRRLAVIGLGTFDWLTRRSEASVRVRNGRVLVKQGELWGVPAFGVIHLSGARVSRADLEAMKTYFAELH
jgi:hypothetical protein